jgi:hypothetical protein
MMSPSKYYYLQNFFYEQATLNKIYDTLVILTKIYCCFIV